MLTPDLVLNHKYYLLKGDDSCNVAPEDRTDCGYGDEAGCLQSGCCYDNSDQNATSCFYKRGDEWKGNQTSLLQTINELRNNLTSCNLSNEDLVDEKNECAEKNADCEANKAQCEANNAQCQDRLNECQNNNSLCLSRIQELEANNTEHQDKIEELENRIQELLTSCQDPCSSKQCGPHSGCTVENNEAVCHCQQGFLGSPPNCSPECVQNSDCPSHEACVR